jgi:hypothetical protein
MQQEIRLQRRAKHSFKCSRNITTLSRKNARCSQQFRYPSDHILFCHLCLSLSPARDLHSSSLFFAIHNSTHGALFHLFCTLLSNLSPCTAPSTAKTLCDSSTRRSLPTVIPANSNQSLRHIPYASACNAVSHIHVPVLCHYSID